MNYTTLQLLIALLSATVAIAEREYGIHFSSFVQRMKDGYVPIALETIESPKGIELHLVKTEINGLEGVMILDTGANNTTLDFKYAKQLKLPLGPERKMRLFFGEIDAYSTVVRSIKFGELYSKHTTEEFPLVATKLDQYEFDKLKCNGLPILGLLGQDQLLQRKAIIDYRTSTLFMLERSIESGSDFHGIWRVTAGEYNGQTFPEDYLGRSTVKFSRHYLSFVMPDDKRVTFGYHYNKSGSAGLFRLFTKDSMKSEQQVYSAYGVNHFDKGKLKLVINLNSAKGIPDELSAPIGSNRVYFVLERVKK